jgi:DNA-directed RNA polymerase specialized sigma24 family protein
MQNHNNSGKNVTEQALVQSWQNGCTDAFDQLYTLHSPAIYRLGWAMLQQAESAEDVVQETFLRAYKARHRFDPDRASFGTWLYQIALNYCRSHLRRKRLFTISWFRQTGEPIKTGLRCMITAVFFMLSGISRLQVLEKLSA